jgi:hypothetical protein
MIHVLQNLLIDDTQFYEMLTNGTFDYLSQIVEEAIIYSHQDLNQNLESFLNIALDLFEHSIDYEFAQIQHDNLIKIQERIHKLC